MSCEVCRQALGAEPSTTRLDVLEHVASCPECARYRAELRAMDGVILQALTIDITPQRAPAAQRRTSMNWRMAATVLLAIGVVSIGWLAYPRQSLAEDLVRHVVIESLMIDPTSPDPKDEEVQRVLKRAGVRLAPNDLSVSFAKICGFRGELVPHLIVRTATGPVTVMVLPREQRIETPRQFEEQGFVGTFAPAPRGVIAVLGKDASVERVTQDVMRALSWEEGSG